MCKPMISNKENVFQSVHNLIDVDAVVCPLDLRMSTIVLPKLSFYYFIPAVKPSTVPTAVPTANFTLAEPCTVPSLAPTTPSVFQ